MDLRLTLVKTLNPLIRPLAGYVPGTALLETTGRRTGRPRRTPVTDGLDGQTFWIVAERGRRADYVRNLRVHPEVRVRVRRRWRSGTARLLSQEDPDRVMPRLNPVVRSFLPLMAAQPMVVRVDLHP